MTDLDTLFNEAAKNYIPDEPSLGKYLDPRNWTEVRGVALIHKDSKELLGNFTHYKHRTEKDCYKYVCSSAQMTAVCEVEGNWNLMDRPKLASLTAGDKFRTTIDVELPELRLRAAKVAVDVTLDDKRHVLAIRLRHDTSFAGQEVWVFPAGTELRTEMSRECKIELYRKVRETR